MSSDVCLRRFSSDEHPSTNLHQSEFSNGGAWEVYLNTQYDNPVSLRTEPHRGACVCLLPKALIGPSSLFMAKFCSAHVTETRQRDRTNLWFSLWCVWWVCWLRLRSLSVFVLCLLSAVEAKVCLRATNISLNARPGEDGFASLVM